MSRSTRVVVGFVLVAVVASCGGGESDWERNSIRPGHQMVLSQAYNSDLFIDSYNREFDSRESLDDCGLAVYALSGHGKVLEETRQHLAAGITTQGTAKIPLTRVLDVRMGLILATNDWMLENHCPGAVPDMIVIGG